jgi:two-component system NtrC family sensor kinase
MCKKVIGGDLSARVGVTPPGELGVLCRAIDHMAAAVAQREQQLKEATQKQIGQSEKLASIGRLAAGIAHEINNPLTGVLTFAHLLKQRQTMSDDERGDVDVIIRETARVRDIVRGLLDFARETPAVKQLLDINGVIRQTTTLVRNQKDFSKITIRTDLDDTLPQLVGDRNQLVQVFLNLALNACEAMPQGGTLTITSALRGSDVVVTVADTGIGIKADDLDKIFDPFFTTKPVGKGTGLGLSVSYGTIQRHGGTLSVESEEGKGATFTITLPAADTGKEGHG